jgi:hypothetical protein
LDGCDHLPDVWSAAAGKAPGGWVGSLTTIVNISSNQGELYESSSRKEVRRPLSRRVSGTTSQRRPEGS